MTIANPVCKRCKGRAVYIGIGGGAEPVCARDCAGRCPKCLTTEIEPFAVSAYMGPFANSSRVMHCKPHGHVWEEREP